MAAGTAYTNHDLNMVPFYIFYSMFGFQRVGDFAWAAGDMQARGFLIGGTAGRTTLAGEGLAAPGRAQSPRREHNSELLAYDPTFAYELAVIVQDGCGACTPSRKNIFYYITCMNENYVHRRCHRVYSRDLERQCTCCRSADAARCA